MTLISVLIPTFERPESFRRAAQSVFAQSVLAQTGVKGVELIAIDNSPDHSLRTTLNELAAAAPIPFRFAHEPRPGVANARNALIALATGRYVAWLDDDEEASPNWLASLLAARNATGAQSVFGPVQARSERVNALSAVVEGLYTRSGPQGDAIVSAPYGMGNSLQPRAMFEGQDFDPRANRTGGEDDRLFGAWREAGAIFAWAADAVVVEHVEGARAQLGHATKRAFAYGQGPSEAAWRQRRLATLARHMCIGAVQCVVFGAGALITALVGRPQALAFLGRATQGAGKVFWFFEQRFYGASS
jgi:glycosyltransferase involved in cell wall biosynthesis